MNLPKITLFLLAALVSPMVSLAQDATGRIFGTVYDQQSAVVPGVRITVTNTATQVERTAATDHEGSFQILASSARSRNCPSTRLCASTLRWKSEPRVRR
jgi:hypothetical protein